MENLSSYPMAHRVAWLLRAIIDPTMAEMRALKVPSDDRARLMLLAIAQQESQILFRDQQEFDRATGELVDGKLGPALGLWQFERGGGVAGVLNHPATRGNALYLCAGAEVSADSDSVWRALKVNDRLACGFARLLLWSDPHPLPTVQDVDGGWAYYLRTWRPGKPHPETWSGYWAAARQALRAAAA